jgi:hypothetical protein
VIEASKLMEEASGKGTRKARIAAGLFGFVLFFFSFCSFLVIVLVKFLYGVVKVLLLAARSL